MRRMPPLLVVIATLAGCAAPAGRPPSLEPRAAEAIDPRLPVEGAVNARAVSAGLAARLESLVARARAGEAAFDPVADRAARLAEAAGARGSEGWTVAQEALSAAVAARAPTAIALGDVDSLAANALQQQGGLSPADFAAIRGAAERIAALDRRQLDRLSAIQRRLAI